MLPYAVPGLLTFTTGIFLSLVCLARFFSQDTQNRNRMYRDGALMLFGFGIFGLIFALRAVVREERLLLTLNNQLQWLASLMMPGTVGFVRHYLGNRYKGLVFWQWMAWSTTALCLVTGVLDLYLVNDWMYYAFGKYPKGSIYAKVWAIIGMIGANYVMIVLLMNWIYYRGNRNITLAVLFHLAANLITQVLATDPDTELIATGVLLVVTALVVWRDRAFLFARGLARE